MTSTVIEIPGNWQYSTWRRTRYCWSRQQRRHWRSVTRGQPTRGWRESYYVGPDSAACTRAPEDGVYEPYWSWLPHAADTCPELASCTCKRMDTIGVASYGTLGLCPLPCKTSNCLIFWSLQSCTHWHSSMIRFHVVAYRVGLKNIQAYSFVAIYCMNSIVFVCATLNCSLLVSCPSWH